MLKHVQENNPGMKINEKMLAIGALALVIGSQQDAQAAGMEAEIAKKATKELVTIDVTPNTSEMPSIFNTIPVTGAGEAARADVYEYKTQMNPANYDPNLVLTIQQIHNRIEDDYSQAEGFTGTIGYSLNKEYGNYMTDEDDTGLYDPNWDYTTWVTDNKDIIRPSDRDWETFSL